MFLGEPVDLVEDSSLAQDVQIFLLDDLYFSINLSVFTFFFFLLRDVFKRSAMKFLLHPLARSSPSFTPL